MIENFTDRRKFDPIRLGTLTRDGYIAPHRPAAQRPQQASNSHLTPRSMATASSGVGILKSRLENDVAINPGISGIGRRAWVITGDAFTCAGRDWCRSWSGSRSWGRCRSWRGCWSRRGCWGGCRACAIANYHNARSAIATRTWSATRITTTTTTA